MRTLSFFFSLLIGLQAVAADYYCVGASAAFLAKLGYYRCSNADDVVYLTIKGSGASLTVGAMHLSCQDDDPRGRYIGLPWEVTALAGGGVLGMRVAGDAWENYSERAELWDDINRENLTNRFADIFDCYMKGFNVGISFDVDEVTVEITDPPWGQIFN